MEGGTCGTRPSALEGRALLSSGLWDLQYAQQLTGRQSPQEQRNGALSGTGPASDLVIDQQQDFTAAKPTLMETF